MAQVEIKARHNGPYKVTGPVRVIDADGQGIRIRGSRARPSPCAGAAGPPPSRSATAPIRRIGFQAAERAVAESEAKPPTALDRPRIPGSGQTVRRGPSPRGRGRPHLCHVDACLHAPSSLQRVRAPEPEMARPVPGMRRMEHLVEEPVGLGGPPELHGGRDAACHRPGGAAGPPWGGGGACLGRLVTGIGELTGCSRRPRARVARAARRGPGNREVHDHGERPRQPSPPPAGASSTSRVRSRQRR